MKRGIKVSSILLRDIDDDILERVDLLYKDKGYKSRNEFLRYKINQIALQEEEERLVDKELRKRESILTLVDSNTKVLAEFLKVNGLCVDDLYKNPNLKEEDYKYDFLEDIGAFKDDTKEVIGKEEIKIRNVRSVVLKRIDCLFEKSRFKNRNEFLLNLLENFVIRNEIRDIKMDEEYKTYKFEKLLDLNIETIRIFMENCLVDVSQFYESMEECYYE